MEELDEELCDGMRGVRDVVGELERAPRVSDDGDDLHRVQFFPRRARGDELPQHYAERIRICTLVVVFRAEHFWSHPLGGAMKLALGADLRGLSHARQPEIRDFHPPLVVDENVWALQILM